MTTAKTRSVMARFGLTMEHVGALTGMHTLTARESIRLMESRPEAAEPIVALLLRLDGMDETRPLESVFRAARGGWK